MSTKSFRQSVTLPSDIKDDLIYVSEKLGKTRSVVISEIVVESLPELANLLRTADAASDAPNETALAFALKRMADFLENDAQK